ncbi:MAG: 4-(cytidine 5'-diphospho)-2-C-methyl-D-erythritol kinase [Oligoflexia bacterium]|nr:4-(cytidine 5'-diphospho)-2-C-methyl-D-erythritol kinase [Oligoflexia bacterium]
MDTQIGVTAPAKINLRLKVCGLREDGYHLLSMLNATLSLSDALAITRTATPGVSLRLDPQHALPGLGAGPENLCVKAAAAYLAQNPLAGGVAIDLTKRIPIGGGLGGGSSDAAAVLMALNQMSERPLDRAALFKLALRLGADVPYFLAGGLCWVGGVGEECVRVDPHPLAGNECILIDPGFPTATAEVYALSRRRAAIKPTPDQPLARLDQPSRETILELIDNDLWPFVEELKPALKTLRAVLGTFRFAKCGLSGSGSTLFLVHVSRDKFEPSEITEIAGALRPFKVNFLVTNFLPNPKSHVK